MRSNCGHIYSAFYAFSSLLLHTLIDATRYHRESCGTAWVNEEAFTAVNLQSGGSARKFIAQQGGYEYEKRWRKFHKMDGGYRHRPVQSIVGFGSGCSGGRRLVFPKRPRVKNPGRTRRVISVLRRLYAANSRRRKLNV